VGAASDECHKRTVALRVLISASNAWNLRCEVREKLIEFVQKTYPDGLPRLRAEIQGFNATETESGPSHR